MHTRSECWLSLAHDPQWHAAYKSCKGYQLFRTPSGTRIEVEQQVNRKLVDVMQRERVSEVILQGLLGEKPRDLSFLPDLPGLKRLAVSSYHDVDWTPIQKLRGLERVALYAHKPPGELDFSLFKNLKSCAVRWHPQWGSVLRCKSLIHLAISHSTRVETFDLRSLPRLREFFAEQCKGLKSVLAGGSSPLESLLIQGCASFRQLSPSGSLRKLRYFWLGGRSKFEYAEIARCKNLVRLWLHNGGRIPSLDFLENCAEMETLHLFGSTTVQDGDLHVFQSLPKLRRVRYKDKRHYSPKYSEEWLESLRRRRGRVRLE